MSLDSRRVGLGVLTPGPRSPWWTTVDRAGVEMEALTSCAVAALTIYDMCKSVDRGITVGDLALWEKTGGRSGHWRRADDHA